MVPMTVDSPKGSGTPSLTPTRPQGRRSQFREKNGGGKEGVCCNVYYEMVLNLPEGSLRVFCDAKDTEEREQIFYPYSSNR